MCAKLTKDPHFCPNHILLDHDELPLFLCHFLSGHKLSPPIIIPILVLSISEPLPRGYWSCFLLFPFNFFFHWNQDAQYFSGLITHRFVAAHLRSSFWCFIEALTEWEKNATRILFGIWDMSCLATGLPSVILCTFSNLTEMWTNKLLEITYGKIRWAPIVQLIVVAHHEHLHKLNQTTNWMR